SAASGMQLLVGRPNLFGHTTVPVPGRKRRCNHHRLPDVSIPLELFEAQWQRREASLPIVRRTTVSETSFETLCEPATDLSEAERRLWQYQQSQRSLGRATRLPVLNAP